MKKQELYTTQEVAEILKVHQRTVFRHIKSGNLKAIKILGNWRIKREDLDRLFDNNTIVFTEEEIQQEVEKLIKDKIKVLDITQNGINKMIYFTIKIKGKNDNILGFTNNKKTIKELADCIYRKYLNKR